MSSLQNKLNNYEVIPPAEAWDKIAAALDEEKDTTHQYPSKLYNLEMSPPAAAWAGISSALEQHTRVAPMRKRAANFYRYAVAAVIIGIAALGVIKWVSGNIHSGSAGKTAVIIPSVTPGNNEKDTAPASQPVTDDENTAPESSSEKEPAMIAQAEQTVKPHIHKAVSRDMSSIRYEYDDTDGDIYNNPIYAYENHVPNLADRYIMLMTPEGKFIRMSKKWGSLICCVSGEEQDADCKDQLKKWQEKMASSPLTTSPGNFLDILNLVNSLDDNSNGL